MPARGEGALVAAMKADPTALVYFVLNVGDGDTQLLLLPPDSNDGVRRLVVVDVATRGKVPPLLTQLHAAGLIQPPGTAGQIRLLVATHPHQDHIGGMSELLDLYNGPSGCIDQFWDPGFFFPGPSFHNLMVRLESSPWIRRLQPTGGTTLFLDSIKVTVIGPGVGLRTRFDVYGVNVNDASITLMVEFPATKVYAEPDPADRTRRNRRLVEARSRRLLLGADAQFTSWAQATVDFPDLRLRDNAILAKELRLARGKDYLRADVFKLSHHASKHGINLELLERVAAEHVIVSSTTSGGRYGFPHALAIDAAREARRPTAGRGGRRPRDTDLGIHVTGGRLDTGEALGSIAMLVPRSADRDVRLFRLMDPPRNPIDLTLARQVRG
jgi:hypothetical protein